MKLHALIISRTMLYGKNDGKSIKPVLSALEKIKLSCSNVIPFNREGYFCRSVLKISICLYLYDAGALRKMESAFPDSQNKKFVETIRDSINNLVVFNY